MKQCSKTRQLRDLIAREISDGHTPVRKRGPVRKPAPGRDFLEAGTMSQGLGLYGTQPEQSGKIDFRLLLRTDENPLISLSLTTKTYTLGQLAETTKGCIFFGDSLTACRDRALASRRRALRRIGHFEDPRAEPDRTVGAGNRYKPDIVARQHRQEEFQLPVGSTDGSSFLGSAGRYQTDADKVRNHGVRQSIDAGASGSTACFFLPTPAHSPSRFQ
ncbi:MAG: hypothetical protein Tsb0019_02390 [Roseibium sp.]